MNNTILVAALTVLACSAQAREATTDQRLPPGPTHAEDCARIKAAHAKTHDVSHRAWGWKDGATGPAGAMIPYYVENAQQMTQADLRAIARFTSGPEQVVDSAGGRADCRPLQRQAAALRPHLLVYAHQLAASKPFCATPNYVVGGQCGAGLDRALQIGGNYRKGPGQDFLRAVARAPQACRQLAIPVGISETPPCRRFAAPGGRLCDQLDVAGARAGMSAAARELKLIKNPELKQVASASLAQIDQSVSLLDQFTRSGKHEDRLLAGAAILTAVANRTIRTSLRCSFCPSQGDPHCPTTSMTPVPDISNRAAPRSPSPTPVPDISNRTSPSSTRPAPPPH